MESGEGGRGTYNDFDFTTEMETAGEPDTVVSDSFYLCEDTEYEH